MAGFWLFALDRNLRLTTLACFEHLVFVDSLISFTIRWAGQALFGTLTPDIIVLTLLYSIAGLGIAIVNDFKSVEGDRALGLQSLPVAFGEETAKWICVGAIDITQLSIAGYLLGAGKPYYPLALLALIVPQVVFQFKYFLKDPVKYDVKYQASAQPFLVLGLLVTALATSH
ncbi:chlorophyll synthase, chloroplastic-like [Vicia villosa]|uniref:chlorophyll synthase, chloroplastic-like n=1 Tax=Vicia villosa TaxID=3911 RepID=UPI00273CED25|nr:chlorophyll synthase, chloroplastic-like [Vicia villosa]